MGEFSNEIVVLICFVHLYKKSLLGFLNEMKNSHIRETFREEWQSNEKTVGNLNSTNVRYLAVIKEFLQ